MNLALRRIKAWELAHVPLMFHILVLVAVACGAKLKIIFKKKKASKEKGLISNH